MGNLTSTLDVKLIDDITKPAQQIGEAMKKVESQIKAIDTAMKGTGASAGFQRQLASIGRSAEDIDRVSQAWRKYASSVAGAENSANWTKSQANQIRAWEQSTIKSLRNVEQQEKAFQRQQQQLATANMRQAERAGERAGVGHMLRSGVLAYTGAHAVIHGGKSVIEQGAETAHELAAIQSAHQPTPAEMDEIKKTALEGAKAVPTSTYADNLKVINETIGAFGDVKHALEHLNFNQRTASVVHAAAGDKIHENAGEMGQAFARFGEMRGSAMDPERYERESAGLAKSMIFTRGNFNPQEMLNFGAQAHAALKTYDEDFLTKTAPILAAERGGERAGTGASAFRNLILGKARDAKQAQQWMDFGLLDPSKVTRNNSGGVIGWTAGAVKNTDLALTNPLKWAEQVQNPAIRGKGINPDDQMELTKVLGTMYRNQMANQFAEDMSQLQSRNRLHKDSALMDKTMGIEQAYDFNLKNDPTQALKTITSAVTDFGQALSAPALQQIGPVLTGIASGVKSLAQIAQDHPHLATAGGIAAGGAGLAGAGWFASQMAGGFGLSKSATELDASAAALMRAAGALGGAGAGEAAADAAGGVGSKTPRPGRLRRFGRIAGKTAMALPLVGAGVEALRAVEEEFPHAETGPSQAERAGAQGGAFTMNRAARNQFAAEKARLGVIDSAQGPWLKNTETQPFPAVAREAGSDIGAYMNRTTGALDIGSQTQAAGANTGGGYLEGLRSQLDAAAQYAEQIAERIRNALDFSATPNISAGGGNSAPTPGRQSSLTNYDHSRTSAAHVFPLG